METDVNETIKHRNCDIGVFFVRCSVRRMSKVILPISILVKPQEISQILFFF